MTLEEKIANFKEWSEHFRNDTKLFLAVDPPIDDKTRNFIISINKKASEVFDYVTDVLEDKKPVEKVIYYDNESDGSEDRRQAEKVLYYDR